jgi:hypothetical protein
VFPWGVLGAAIRIRDYAEDAIKSLKVGSIALCLLEIGIHNVGFSL